MKTLKLQNSIEDETQAIRNFIDLQRNKSQFYPDFEILENGKKWVCGTIGNGNPWDCFITKKGTKGQTSKTFKRIYVK